MKKFTGALIIFILGVTTGVTYHEGLLTAIQPLQGVNPQQIGDNYLEDTSNTPTLKANTDLPKIELCFTPPNKHCAHLIAKLIDKAQSSVYMQAYGLTHPEIIESLLKAKQKGVEVKLLLDRSNLSPRYLSNLQELKEAGIEVIIDRVPGIAHNKVIIIDELNTITGSFNFTVSADTRNAENIVIIEDREIAKSYLLNWLERKARSRERELDEKIYQ